MAQQPTQPVQQPAAAKPVPAQSAGVQPQAVQPIKKKKKWWIWVIVAVVVIAIAIGVGLYLWLA